MAHYQRLLLIANPNLKEAPALLRAIALARASGAMLDVRAFIEPAPMAHVWEENRDEEGDQRYQRHYLHWRDQTLQRLNAQGLEVNVQVVFTCDPLLDIVKCVEELKPDLVIKDVTVDPVLGRVFVTPLDYHLLRGCPVALHLVNQVHDELPHQIVAAVDLFDTVTQIRDVNDAIIQAAHTLAVQCDASLHLLYAYDLSPAFNGDTPLITGCWNVAFMDELRASLYQAFNTLAERYGIAPERRHFFMGLPMPVISAFVDDYQADVVVMGTLHRVGTNRFIGSTMERALYSLQGSILAVRQSDSCVEENM
ncbi:universal stress protein [Pseudomonas sp. B14-6]|jgi:universal stress protein E|uniref:universal stress protein n=1 Tax=Pseudomonas sp. B14-6 TaxID=2738843 RepID=UPI00155ED4A3|nr:universal stress protein [Pseudomonas sp. B14-6]QKG65179.1 universal stress protein [Pseudomonas sp. B14-6]